MKLETFFEKFDQLVETSGAIAKLREFVLQLAVTGRLLPQDSRDEPTAVTLAKSEKVKRPARFENRTNARIEGVGALSIGPTTKPVPLGWACVPLIEVARLESGHTPSRNRPDWWGGNVPWIGVVDARLHDGGTIFDTIQHTNAEGLANSAARLLPTGTVCVSRTASVGYVVTMGRSMATSQDFVNWVPSPPITSTWLQLVLTAEKPGFRRFSKGAVHQTIYYPEWIAMHTLLPPLAEQKRIVAKVDELMALCDRLEAQQQERETRHAALARASLARFADAPTPANLDFLFHNSYAIAPADLRKAILTLAVQGKLVSQDPTDEPAVDLLQKICAEQEALVKARQIRRSETAPVAEEDEPFAIPGTWAWTRLGQIGDWGSGSTPPRGNHELYGGSVPWLKSGELNDNMALAGSEETVTEIAVKICSFRQNKPGDVLLAMYGATIGKAAILAKAAVTNQAVCGCTPFRGVLNTYLFYYLLSQRDNFQAAGEGGAQPNISKVKIVGFQFPLPPKAEQRRIVAKVEQLMAFVDALETQLADSRRMGAELLEAVVAELTVESGLRKT